MPSVLSDPKLDGLLTSLHQTSKAHDEAIERYFFHERTGPWNDMEPRDHAFMADKLEALHQAPDVPPESTLRQITRAARAAFPCSPD
jgi:hypothetical protein